MRRGTKVVLAAAGTALGAVLLAHAAVVASGASCPMHDPGAAELEAQRRSAMLPLAVPNGRTAPSHDLWVGASRDRFTTGEEASGRQCHAEQSGATVRCEGNGTESLARFDPDGRLVALDRVRYGLAAADGERELGAMLTEARATLGEPGRTWGEATASYLAHPLRQAGFEYRFVDVALDVTATHLGRDGIVLREQHRAMRGLREGS